MQELLVQILQPIQYQQANSMYLTILFFIKILITGLSLKKDYGQNQNLSKQSQSQMMTKKIFFITRLHTPKIRRF